MIHVIEYYSDDAVDHLDPDCGDSWEGYGARKADRGEEEIRKAQKNRTSECVTALRMMKRIANLVDTIFINNMMSAIEQMDAGPKELSDIRQELRKYFGFTPNHRATGTPEYLSCRLQNCMRYSVAW